MLLVDKIKGEQYSDAQFKALIKEEKDQVVQYQEEAKKNKRNKRKLKAQKRRLARTAFEQKRVF